MKKFFTALIMFVLLLFPYQSAQAAEACIVTVNQVKICGELLGQPLPEIVKVTVTPKPITSLVPTPVPGPTKTVTATPQPGPTVYMPGPTVTVYPSPKSVTKTEIVTRTPQAVPTTTVTVTRQPVTPDATLLPRPKSNDGGSILPGGISTPQAVGIGTLTLLGFMALILLGMWLGYVMGYKDANRKEMKFLYALRDQFYTKGKHRA